ncbi:MULTISPECIES: hypothetical protein [unclassified Roseateles]|uniref:hypothetical protein n=1 Tax=unclassified Roseateles TaxID=2626991 RepID=UPI0012E3E3C8|nr:MULTISPECIES: hypothetical protein [unclassified Roseateles]
MKFPEVLAFEEGGTLRLFASVKDAELAFEGVDVESGTVSFYDQHGQPLRVDFVTPNRRGRLLGHLAWFSSGAYKLVPAEPGIADPIALAIFESCALDPNPWFASLEALKSELRRRGVDAQWREG